MKKENTVSTLSKSTESYLDDKILKEMSHYRKLMERMKILGLPVFSYNSEKDINRLKTMVEKNFQVISQNKIEVFDNLNDKGDVYVLLILRNGNDLGILPVRVNSDEVTKVSTLDYFPFLAFLKGVIQLSIVNLEKYYDDEGIEYDKDKVDVIDLCYVMDTVSQAIDRAVVLIPGSLKDEINDFATRNPESRKRIGIIV